MKIKSFNRSINKFINKMPNIGIRKPMAQEYPRSLISLWSLDLKKHNKNTDGFMRRIKMFNKKSTLSKSPNGYTTQMRPLVMVLNLSILLSNSCLDKWPSKYEDFPSRLNFSENCRKHSYQAFLIKERLNSSTIIFHFIYLSFFLFYFLSLSIHFIIET